eukprot:CCRYP_001959-RA/>CCRYP_001959-RA protein AED:0.01 eAED:0.03 QI:0/0.5/0.66/1/0/0/3/1574/117
MSEYATVLLKNPHNRSISKVSMWLHLPSAFVGSVFAGSGFLLIHRELSHRRRLTTKWEIQEYVEAQWKGIKNSSGESVANSSKKIMNSNGHLMQTDWLTSSWNKAIATVREFASQKK